MKIQAEVLLDWGWNLLITKFIRFDSIILQFRYEKNCLLVRRSETIDIVSVGDDEVSICTKLCTKLKKLGENMSLEDFKK